MTKETLSFDGDKLYYERPLPEYGDTICERRLVMTKEIFLTCYKKWVLGEEEGNNDKTTDNQ